MSTDGAFKKDPDKWSIRSKDNTTVNLNASKSSDMSSLGVRLKKPDVIRAVANQDTLKSDREISELRRSSCLAEKCDQVVPRDTKKGYEETLPGRKLDEARL